MQTLPPRFKNNEAPSSIMKPRPPPKFDRCDQVTRFSELHDVRNLLHRGHQYDLVPSPAPGTFLSEFHQEFPVGIGERRGSVWIWEYRAFWARFGQTQLPDRRDELEWSDELVGVFRLF